MSVTSLHRHFLALTSLSPMQYQKRMRLQEARSLLLSHSQDVAAVGFSVGYESPSQFSREYKRPVWDVARQRRGTTAVSS
jgi:transcriptional regulator GlxA family with amidase domain